MLDPEAQTVLDLIKAAGRPPITALAPADARQVYRNSRRALTPDSPDVAFVEDLEIPGPRGAIALRHYRGIGTRPGMRLPCLVFMHGGGWVIGDLDTHDYVCRKLANAAACAVVSVDYRLAPEHVFPAAVEDCVAAVRHVAAAAADLGIDAGRLAVGGDSAGGNLAAVMAHLARDGELPPLAFQLLIYPATDMAMRHPSHALPLAGFPLEGSTARWFARNYMGESGDVGHWWASPLKAPRFGGLAQAFVLTAGYDPLVDEGRDYAAALEKAGVQVAYLHMSDQMHGFITMSKLIRSAETALDIMGLALARALEPSATG
ncbi:alpha/beta hydrolase [Chelatococcus reniformis]|uniref:Acetylhydrolase n=1 Tax=Chelatococcus reniformis TaxID=1494448 RepID=A0A916TXT2_9HYPH|nr:alpha/beta hydrolase [Chelatococcus reniformis]GGC46188.1 acetylhydrolase [Chelatococcus reniformis]